MSQHVPQSPLPDVSPASVAIITTEWNAFVNDRLVKSASEVLQGADVDFEVYRVPGAVELTYAAAKVMKDRCFDAVIVFGTVIRGGTPHFDYVCQSVTQGVTMLNAQCDIPVIFGVLTVDTEQDALDRAGGCCGDKGRECAETAIKMIHFAGEV